MICDLCWWQSHPVGQSVTIRDCPKYNGGQYVSLSTVMRDLLPMINLLKKCVEALVWKKQLLLLLRALSKKTTMDV